MAEQSPPEALFGLNKELRERFERIDKKLEAHGKLFEALVIDLADLLRAIGRLEEETKTGLSCLERAVKTIASQLEEMDAKLTVISDTETVLGQSIQTVINYLKSNPNPTPTDLTAQLGVLENISQRLIASNANTLANLPPTPEPVPSPPNPAPERRR